MEAFTSEQFKKAEEAAARAVWERWRYIRGDLPNRLLPSEVPGFHGAPPIRSIHLEQEPNLQLLQRAGIPVEHRVGENAEKRAYVDGEPFSVELHDLIWGALSHIVRGEVHDNVRDQVTEWVEISEKVAAESNAKQGCNPPRDGHSSLAIIGLKAFAKELGITIPSQAAGRGRADET